MQNTRAAVILQDEGDTFAQEVSLKNGRKGDPSTLQLRSLTISLLNANPLQRRVQGRSICSNGSTRLNACIFTQNHNIQVFASSQDHDGFGGRIVVESTAPTSVLTRGVIAVCSLRIVCH